MFPIFFTLPLTAVSKSNLKWRFTLKHVLKHFKVWCFVFNHCFQGSPSPVEVEEKAIVNVLMFNCVVTLRPIKKIFWNTVQAFCILWFLQIWRNVVGWDIKTIRSSCTKRLDVQISISDPLKYSFLDKSQKDIISKEINKSIVSLPLISTLVVPDKKTGGFPPQSRCWGLQNLRFL